MSQLSSGKTCSLPFFLNKNYKITTKLAKGGYSEIFLADALEISTPVIVKTPLLSKNSSIKLKRETDLMLKLKEIKGVPQILDQIAIEDKEYLVIERLGKSLETLLNDFFNFSLKTVIMIGLQLLTILEKIHEKGVIHRDIKPGNILISETEQLYLIDYGMAKKFTEKEIHLPMNQTKKSFKGTLMFASRNAHFGHSCSRRDDLESLGYTLVFLYRGGLPWILKKKADLDVKTIGNKKRICFENGVYPDLPLEFKLFFQYIGKLKYEEAPDYQFLRNLLENMAKRYDLDLNKRKWEWDLDEQKIIDSQELREEEISSGESFESRKREKLENEENLDNEEINDSNCFNNMQSNLMLIKMSPVKMLGNKFEKKKKNEDLKNVFKKMLNLG